MALQRRVRGRLTRWLLAILAVSCAACAAETFNGPAVKVNTQIVGIRDVERVYGDSQVLIQDKLRKGELSEAQLPAAVRVAWSEALETATQDAIMDQRADQRRKDIVKYYISRSGGHVSAERVKEFFDREVAMYLRALRREMVAAAGGEEELRSALKRRGQTLREWEGGLERELFRRDVLFMELGPIVRSPAAARKFYEKHPELFRQEEAWQLRRIRIAKSSFASADTAREAARLAREKLAAGGDFAALAAKVSDDAEYAAQGGLLTMQGKTELPSGQFPFEEKLAADLKDGALSEVAENGAHFEIVQRLGYRPLSVQPFEQSAEQAEALAYREKVIEKKKELFLKLKKESYVEILQKDPPPHLLPNARLKMQE